MGDKNRIFHTKGREIMPVGSNPALVVSEECHKATARSIANPIKVYVEFNEPRNV